MALRAVICPWWRVTARPGDGQAQPDAAAGSAAVFFDPVEGLEDFGERVGRHAGAVVTKGDDGAAVFGRQLDVDGTTLGRMPDGVAKHVIAGTPQKLVIAGHHRRAADLGRQPASLRFGFQAAAFEQVAKELAQVDFLEISRAGVALGARELKELVDELSQPVGFLADSGASGLSRDPCWSWPARPRNPVWPAAISAHERHPEATVVRLREVL